ncbi:hypothetical protein CBL_09820 [Carabus blaptoides fortunei]
MSTEKFDEHPFYVKSTVEPEEETLVLRRSFISRLPDKALTGHRRSDSEGSNEDPSSDDENDGIVLEIEDQPKESKSILTPDELILSVNGPEGTRRSSITLPSDLRRTISDYLVQRRKRRKRFKVSVVENQEIHLSGGSNTNAVMFRRADEPTSSEEYSEDTSTLARRFIRIRPGNQLQPKKLFSAGIRIGVLPGDKVDYTVSKPIHLQMGINKVPGFIPGMSIKPSPFPLGSLQFGPKLETNKFEIKGQPRKPYGFKLSTENKPYDMYQYEIGNKRPESQYSIQQIPEYIPEQDNGFSKVSVQNKPYAIKGYPHEIPRNPGQIKSPSLEFSIGSTRKPYGPDTYNVQQYEIPGYKIPGPIQIGMPEHHIPGPIQIGMPEHHIPGPIQFGMPGQNIPGQTIPGHIQFGIPGPPNSPFGSFKPGQANIPYGSFKRPDGSKPYDFKGSYGGFTYPPAYNNIPSNSFNLPDIKRPDVSYIYSSPATVFYKDPVYGVSQLPENFGLEQPKLSIPGQKFEIPGHKFEIPGQKFEIPGEYNPGQINAPSDSFKISIGTKPYDSKVPDNNYQYQIPGHKFEIPGHKFEIPGQKFEITGGYTPGQANPTSGSFKLSIGNKPYDSKVPDNNYQYQIPGHKFEIPGHKFEIPGQKFEIPGGYTPGQANPTSGSFKLSIGNKPYDSKVPDNNYQYQIPGHKFEIPGQKFEIPGGYTPGQANPTSHSFKLSIGNKPYGSKVPGNNYQYEIPGQKIEIPGGYTPGQVNPPSNFFKLSLGNKPYDSTLPGIHSQPVEAGYTQHRESYPIQPSYTNGFRRKVQENPPGEPMQEDLREELLEKTLEQIAKEFKENMKKERDQQQPAKTTEGPKEENDDNKNEQKQTQEPQTVEPNRRGVNEIDTHSPMSTPQQDMPSIMTQGTPVIVKFAEPVKNPTRSSEEGYEFGISSESSDEEATLANTYAKNKGNSDEHGHRRKCDETSEYEYYDESEEETSVKPEAQETRRTSNDVALQSAINKVQGIMDKENVTQDDKSTLISKPPNNVTEISMTAVRKFGDHPESFNASLENFKPHVISTTDLTNSSEITDENVLNQNEDGVSNTGTFTFDLGKSFPPTNTSDARRFADNLTSIISDTINDDDKDTKLEALPINPTTELTDLKPTEKYSSIEEPIQNMTEIPMQRRNTVVIEPNIPQAENSDDNPVTGDLIPQDTVPEEVTEPVVIDEALSTLQTETPVYTESVENPTEVLTEQVEYFSSTLAPDMVEGYTESVTTVSFTDFPSVTTEETKETIEFDTDVTGQSPVTIADMGKEIDYVQYYGTDDPGSEITIEETTTVSPDLEYTTLNPPDSSTTIEFTTLNYEDTTMNEAVTEENILANTELPQRKNEPSEDIVEDIETDPSFENGLPFLKHKLMSEDYKDDGNYENFILEDILEKPLDALTDKEKESFERMVNLSKHPDDVTFNRLPKNYRPLNSTDNQFLLRGLLGDRILDNDYLRKGVILLKNYPFEKDIDSLKTRTGLKEILRDFKNKPNATTSEEKHMNLILSQLASHPKDLDSVYEEIVKKRGEPDANELTLIDQWLRLLKLNKGIELMYLYNNNGGGPEDEFRIFLQENLMKKKPEALSEEEQRLLDILVSIYKKNFINQQDKEEQDIVNDDLYKLGILTMRDSPNQDNLGLLSQELLEFIFKKPDTELNDREYKIYNYLMKLAGNPNELLKRYNTVMGTVKNDLDEKYVELNNGKIPTSFEEMSTSLNDIMPKKPPEELTQHDYYILYLLKYLADNKELIPHLANFEHDMVYNLPLFNFGIITTVNSPNRNKKQLLSDEILKTVMEKPEEELNAKEKMTYKHLMNVPLNHVHLMDTYNFIMNMLKNSVNEKEDKTKNKYMVAIIKIPIKSRDKNGDVYMNKTFKISMDDIHSSISNLTGEPLDNEKAVFIMPEENHKSLSPLNLDDKTKLVQKLEVTRASMKVNRAQPTQYGEVIQQYLDDLVTDLIRLLKSDSTTALNETGEINYDVNDNEPDENLQQLLGQTILKIRRRKTNPTEVDDGELIQYLTTLQRKLMKEIKSEYGTTDFKQQPVQIERRYTAGPDEMDYDEGYYDEDSEIPSIDETYDTPEGHGRGMTDTPVQLALQAIGKWFMAHNQKQQPNSYRRAGPGQYTTDYPQQQSFQEDMAVPPGQRRGIMDTPVQLAMKAVAKWFTAQNQMQQPNSYRRAVPGQDITDYSQQQSFEEDMAVPVGQRRGMLDAPVELVQNTVQKFADAPNVLKSLSSFRRSAPGQDTTDYSQQQSFEEDMAVPVGQRRGMMDAPVQLVQNTVQKFADPPNVLKSLSSFRRSLPDEHLTDYSQQQDFQEDMAVPVGQRRGMLDHQSAPVEHTTDYSQQQDFQEEMAVPVGQRRGMLDAPVELVQNTVQKFADAPNVLKSLSSFGRSAPVEHTTDYSQQQDFQKDMALPVGQRRGMMDAPLQLVKNTVRKVADAPNVLKSLSSFGRSAPVEYTTGYSQQQDFQEDMVVPVGQRRGMLDAPIELVQNTVRKVADAPNVLKSLTSFRRNVPDEPTDYRNEHTSQKKIIEPARRYPDYYADTLEDYPYEDDIYPVGYYKRSNIMHDGRDEESEEPTMEEVYDNRKSQNTPIIPLRVQRNKGRPQRNNRNKFRRNGELEGNDKVWTIKGFKRRSDTSDDPDDQRELLTIHRRAIPLNNEGNNIEEDEIARMGKHRKHRQRDKYSRNSRRRRLRKKQRHNKLVRRFNEQVQSTTVTGLANVAPLTLTEFVPTTPQVDAQNATTVLIPSRRQKEEESSTKQTEPVRVLGQDYRAPVGQMNYNDQAYNVQKNEQPYHVQNNEQPYLAQNNEQPYLALNNEQPHLAQNNEQPYLAQNNDQPYLAQNNDQAYLAQNNEQPYLAQNNEQPYHAQNQIQTYTDGNMPPDYTTTPASTHDNIEQVPQAEQMNYDPQNTSQVQTPLSQKNRRSADSTSLIRMLNPLEIVKRLNPFISRDENPQVETTENSKDEENREDETPKSDTEQEDVKNSTDNVESSTRQEYNDATEQSSQTSTNLEEIENNTILENINTTEEKNKEEENVTDSVENTSKQENNNTTEHIPHQENISNVQKEQDTIELVQDSQQELDSVMETTQFADPAGNSTTGTTQTSLENNETI